MSPPVGLAAAVAMAVCLGLPMASAGEVSPSLREDVLAHPENLSKTVAAFRRHAQDEQFLHAVSRIVIDPQVPKTVKSVAVTFFTAGMEHGMGRDLIDMLVSDQVAPEWKVELMEAAPARFIEGNAEMTEILRVGQETPALRDGIAVRLHSIDPGKLGMDTRSALRRALTLWSLDVLKQESSREVAVLAMALDRFAFPGSVELAVRGLELEKKEVALGEVYRVSPPLIAMLMRRVKERPEDKRVSTDPDAQIEKSSAIWVAWWAEHSKEPGFCLDRTLTR